MSKPLIGWHLSRLPVAGLSVWLRGCVADVLALCSHWLLAGSPNWASSRHTHQIHHSIISTLSSFTTQANPCREEMSLFGLFLGWMHDLPLVEKQKEKKIWRPVTTCMSFVARRRPAASFPTPPLVCHHRAMPCHHWLPSTADFYPFRGHRHAAT